MDMSAIRVPFNKPSLAGPELEYIADVFSQGQTSGDGRYTEKCHRLLEELLGVSKAFLTTSCTHAFEMSALLLNLQEGDEVIVPSFTFVSTANAFALRGARPIFADIRRDTLNIDEVHVEELITAHTKAIVPVHYGGVGCAMDRIMDISTRRGIAVVEDNAHGLFGKYRGQPLGSFGRMAAVSFHETKNFSCGEGGALFINDPALIERAEIIREKGTDRTRFFRGEVDKYNWVDIGSSYLPSDLLAAYLYAQLEARERILGNRRRIWDFYFEHLSDWAVENGVGLPNIPVECEQPYHMFYILLPSLDARQRLIRKLKTNGIVSAFHYLPLHLSQMGRRFGGAPGQCPVTEEISDRLLRLPFYTDLGQSEQDEIVALTTQFKVG